jgi:hypothetical protein
MPIIVDEVVISVEVGNAAAGGAASAPSPILEKQIIVAECVERVLDILREREEP